VTNLFQIDEETVQNITDEVLATYIPKFGDRVALKITCRNLKKKKKKRKRNETYSFI
jgi:hypothetical protein